MGYDGVKTGARGLQGRKGAGQRRHRRQPVTKANMDGEKQHALLFPKVK